jgi:hypothetical protein
MHENRKDRITEAGRWGRRLGLADMRQTRRQVVGGQAGERSKWKGHGGRHGGIRHGAG